MEIRELNADIELTSEEVEMLSANSVSVDELREFLRTSGPQNLDAAIGGIAMARVAPVVEEVAPVVEAVEESPAVEEVFAEVAEEEASKLPEDVAATS